ncbi:hypothetical protein KAR48_12630 [bacterium]|nr:hypothetical protein [bacterium]
MTAQCPSFICNAPIKHQPLLRQFAEDMQLRGMSERTIEMYVGAKKTTYKTLQQISRQNL